MSKKIDLFWIVARAAMGGLILAAIIAQAMVTFGGALEAGRDMPTTIVNFFSFFTILSNVGAVIVLLWAAVWLFKVRANAASVEPRSLAITLAAVATYMILTGIVYNVLLRGIPLPQGTTVGWSNEILHVVGPIFLLLEVIFAPHRRRLNWRAIFAVLVFPIVWVGYTLIRGPLTVNPTNGNAWWYPYPFLDPHTEMSGGYGGVFAYVVGIAVAIMLVAALVFWTSRIRARKS